MSLGPGWPQQPPRTETGHPVVVRLDLVVSAAGVEMRAGAKCVSFLDLPPNPHPLPHLTHTHTPYTGTFLLGLALALQEIESHGQPHPTAAAAATSSRPTRPAAAPTTTTPTTTARRGDADPGAAGQAGLGLLQRRAGGHQGTGRGRRGRRQRRRRPAPGAAADQGRGWMGREEWRAGVGGMDTQLLSLLIPYRPAHHPFSPSSWLYNTGLGNRGGDWHLAPGDGGGHRRLARHPLVRHRGRSQVSADGMF